MTEEEKKLVEQKALEEAAIIAAAEDPILLRDKRIAELEEERNNYKNVALKRLGKLPGDAEFMEGENKTGHRDVNFFSRNRSRAQP